MSLGEGVAVTCAGRAEVACVTCAGELVSTSGFDSVINSASGTDSSTASDLTSTTTNTAGGSGLGGSKTDSTVIGQASGLFA